MDKSPGNSKRLCEKWCGTEDMPPGLSGQTCLPPVRTAGASCTNRATIQSSPNRTRCALGALLRFLLVAAFWNLICHSGELRAEPAVTEYDLKAAFLCNFAQFVKWPGGASGTIGILGDDPFGGKLEKALQGKLSIKRSRRPEDLKSCQIVFVSKSERGNVSGIIANLGEAHVLTVGDSDGFARQGGVIGFTMDGDKVRFEINTAAARRAGLVISSHLLKLASRVFSS